MGLRTGFGVALLLMVVKAGLVEEGLLPWLLLVLLDTRGAST